MIYIQHLLDIVDITDITDINNNEAEEISNVYINMNANDKKSDEVISTPQEIVDTHVDDMNITIIQSEPKHAIGNSPQHHKSLHVNELRKMAVQLNLLPQVEAKKLKKDDLIDLISKSSEAKQD